MESLKSTIKEYYQLNKHNSGSRLDKVNETGHTEGYCEFTGGKKIYIQRKGEGEIISVNSLQTTPTGSAECIPSLWKKSDFDNE